MRVTKTEQQPNFKAYYAFPKNTQGEAIRLFRDSMKMNPVENFGRYGILYVDDDFVSEFERRLKSNKIKFSYKNESLASLENSIRMLPSTLGEKIRMGIIRLLGGVDKSREFIE